MLPKTKCSVESHVYTKLCAAKSAIPEECVTLKTYLQYTHDARRQKVRADHKGMELNSVQ